MWCVASAAQRRQAPPSPQHANSPHPSQTLSCPLQNIYNIYGDCTLGSTIDTGRIDRATGLRVYSKAPVAMREGGPVACIDETIAKYLGRADVATALHVVPTQHWSVCGSNSSFDYHRTEADERLDVYPTIYNAGVRVLIYNGEADACVPWIDNSNWVSSMNFTVAKPWTSWESLGQNAGYITAYTTPSGSDFGFATVKGAGVSLEQSAAAQNPAHTAHTLTSNPNHSLPTTPRH